MSGQFYLSSDGQRWPADLAAAVARFEVEVGLGRASRLQLRLRNDAMTWQDHPLLAEGRELVAQFGAADRTIVTRMRIHQVKGTDPLLVPAYGAGADLGDSPRWRLFGAMTYPEIAGLIARERGLTVSAAPGQDVRRTQVAQAGETDGQFLARLAEEIGWEFWVHDRQLYFRQPDYGADPVIKLVRGENTYRFDPQEQTLMQPGEVLLRTFNLERKEYAELTVNGQNADRTVLGPASLRVPAAGRLTAWTCAQDRREATAAARGLFETLERSTVTVRFKAGGDVALIPGAVVEVEGYGNRWDGLYRVALARHQVSLSEYIVEGELQRNGAGLVGEVEAAGGAVNRSSTPEGRPIASVQVIDLQTGQSREEEIR